MHLHLQAPDTANPGMTIEQVLDKQVDQFLIDEAERAQPDILRIVADVPAPGTRRMVPRTVDHEVDTREGTPVPEDEGFAAPDP